MYVSSSPEQASWLEVTTISHTTVTREQEALVGTSAARPWSFLKML